MPKPSPVKEEISLEQAIEELEDMFLMEKEKYLYEFILQAIGQSVIEVEEKKQEFNSEQIQNT